MEDSSMQMSRIARFFAVVSIGLAVFAGTLAFANEGASTTSASILATPVDFTKTMSSEIGMTVSSLNRGSVFTSLSINREFGNWFTGGLRALVPTEFNREAQTYIFQAYGRLPILNNENVIYFEPQISQGYLSSNSDASSFWLIGAAYGYNRRFSDNFTVGANVGVDFSTWRISEEGYGVGQRSFYSRIGLTGGYYF
jgi:hypothetical protein